MVIVGIIVVSLLPVFASAGGGTASLNGMMQHASTPLILLPVVFVAACATRMGAGGKRRNRRQVLARAMSIASSTRHALKSSAASSIFAEKLYRRKPRAS